MSKKKKSMDIKVIFKGGGKFSTQISPMIKDFNYILGLWQFEYSRETYNFRKDVREVVYTRKEIKEA